MGCSFFVLSDKVLVKIVLIFLIYSIMFIGVLLSCCGDLNCILG